MRYSSLIFFAIFLSLAGCGGGSGGGPENSPPVFSSDSAVFVDENDNVVYTAEATDADGDNLEYSLAGTDALLFAINASTGDVVVLTALDYENPRDADMDNVYVLTLTASDGAGSTDLPVTITVTREEVDTTSLSGTVSMGILQNAHVAAYAVENSVISESTLGTAVTDEEGLFTLDIENPPELIYLVVTGVDPETRLLMQCNLKSCGEAEAGSVDTDESGTIDFGEWQVVGADFELVSYVANWEEGEEARVNLLTHLAAISFETSPTVEELEAEYEAIEEDLGLVESPEEMVPVDVTDEAAGVDDLTYTLIMAALLSLAEEEAPEEAVDLVGSINALEEILDGDSLADSDELLLTEITAEALEIAENLPEETVDRVSELLEIANENAAAQETGLLATYELPLMPPDSSLFAQ